MADSSPLMTQYQEIKSKYDDSILLFRVGDFYETFFDDAVEVSRLLNIALTSRDKNKANPIPLAGVPFHAAENYVTKLLAAGKQVAICEQVEDAAAAKGLVRREVVEVLTPGTALNEQLLIDDDNNFCMALAIDGSRAGIALTDVSTGDFAIASGGVDELPHLLQGKRVRELLVAPDVDNVLLRETESLLGFPYVKQINTTEDYSAELAQQFGDANADVVSTLSPLEQAVSGALVHRCRELRGGDLPQIVRIRRLADSSYLSLDEETIANLELFDVARGGRPNATLLKTLDESTSPMGARTIRSWMQTPLADVAGIDQRLDAVARVHTDASLAEVLQRQLRPVADIERLTSRIAARKAIPREFHALRVSLAAVPGLQETARKIDSDLFRLASADLGDHTSLCGDIERAIVEDPPGHLRDGGVIKKGFDADLDELIERSEAAKTWIANLETREREATGIAQLKVGFNKVFGYYLEVTNAHRDKVPERYLEKQTLVNSRRYYTEELKNREQEILQAEETRVAHEQRVFEKLCACVTANVDALQLAARAIGRIDAILSLAVSAKKYGFTRPIVDTTRSLEIVGGRHPVIERFSNEGFVPNDLHLEPEQRQFGLITGPNMSGKSTFLRQTALIVVMAQMGSFVPAERARIGCVDRVFTRVGASDRLSRGESTFLVEMNETARILRDMTDRSLVLLDEIGRGTSTYDGLSIAWAVTEFILGGDHGRPRTLFATHFHELTQLRRQYPRLVNLKITIREWEGGIVFLRKIVNGTSDKSFGIHAAKIAGLPQSVIARAEEILGELERRRDLVSQAVGEHNPGQLGLFEPGGHSASDSVGDVPALPGAAVLEELRAFSVDESTPLDALQFLRKLQDGIDG